MDYEVSQLCYPSPADAVREGVAAFSQHCNLILGCEYQPAQHSCTVAPTRPLEWFRVLVVCCFVVVLAKELAKVASVLWCLLWRRGVVPVRLRLVVSSTPAVFLLALRQEGRSRFQPDLVDVMFAKTQLPRKTVVEEFVFQAILEDGPQFTLAWYYLQHVTQTGLTSVGALSMAVTGASILARLLFLLLDVWSRPLPHKEATSTREPVSRAGRADLNGTSSVAEKLASPTPPAPSSKPAVAGAAPSVTSAPVALRAAAEEEEDADNEEQGGGSDEQGNCVFLSLCVVCTTTTIVTVEIPS
jgi:hypothetical protein